MPLSLSLDYSSDAQFTYDSTLVEFSGGVCRLKSQAPANALSWATFTSGINLNYGGGTLTGTAVGGAAASSGELNLNGGTLKYVTYPVAGNAAITTTGAIRFKYRPNYSGSPAAARGLVAMLGTGLQNMIQLNHLTDGSLELSVFNASGSGIINGMLDGAWSPTSGTQYEFLLVIDVLAGATKLFINGAQHGSTQTGTGSRNAATTLLLGTNYNNAYSPDGKYDDLAVYSVAPYTAAYTAGYTLPEALYSTANPAVTLTTAVLMAAISNFSDVESASGSDSVKFHLLVNSQAKYHNGTAWANSDASLAQSNSAAQIEANAAGLDLSSSDSVKVVALLHSADGSTRPSITSAELSYSPGEPSSAASCVVYVWLKDIVGETEAESATLKATLSTPFFSGQKLIQAGYRTVAFNSDGYAEIELVPSGSKQYAFSVTYIDNDVPQTLSLGSGSVPASASSPLSSVITL